MAYEIKSNEWRSIYVGRTIQQVINRISQEDQHLFECGGSTNDIEWKNVDACFTVEKLMTNEAIYISKLKTGLNTSNEYRGQELKIKICLWKWRIGQRKFYA